MAPCFLKDACIIAKAALPVFALHALDDTVALAQCTINSIRYINDCRPRVSPNVVLYPNGGYIVFLKKTYDTAHRYQDPNVYEWMLAQNRKLAPNKKPVAQLTAASAMISGKGLISLIGKGSFDPDGKLVSCSWERLSGPQPRIFNILAPGLAELTGLTAPGKYTFVIKVVDDRAEWSTDTVSVNLSATTAVDNPPVADAGKDVTLSAGQSVKLNPGSSYDKDGRIVDYQWSLLSGPPAQIAAPNVASAAVQQLSSGTYVFRLRVIDDRDAMATDVMQVNVTGNDQVLSGDSAFANVAPQPAGSLLAACNGP